MSTKPVTDDTFQADVLDSETPVLVDFWAEWCTPCKMIAPALEEIADELSGQVVIAKVDIEEHPEVASRFGVRNIPTMLLFKNGEIAATQVGAAPKSVLKNWLQQRLAAA